MYGRIDLAATRQVHRNIPVVHEIGGRSALDFFEEDESHSITLWERQCLLIHTLLQRPDLGALTRLLRWTLLPMPHGLPRTRIIAYNERLSFDVAYNKPLSLTPKIQPTQRLHGVRFNEGSGTQ